MITIGKVTKKISLQRKMCIKFVSLVLQSIACTIL